MSANTPVIVIHITSGLTGRNICDDHPHRAILPEHKDVPRVLCGACRLLTFQAQAFHLAREIGMALEAPVRSPHIDEGPRKG